MKSKSTSIIAYAFYDGQEVPIVHFDMGRAVAVIGDKYEFLHAESLTHSRFPDEPEADVAAPSAKPSDQPDVDGEPPTRPGSDSRARARARV